MQKNRPIPGHRQTSLCKKMGLFKLIGSFSHWTCRAHSRRWQFLSLDMLGPIAVIGSFLHAWEWAHSRTSTVSLIEHTGPIRVIGWFCSCMGMGPIKLIGSFSHWTYWAHSSSLENFLMCSNGPIQIIGSFLKEVNGPIQAHGQFSEGSEWAHSSSWAVFFTHANGPIKDIDRFLKEVNGPIQVHWQVLSLKKLSPFMVIGIFSSGSDVHFLSFLLPILWWAHTSASAWNYIYYWLAHTEVSPEHFYGPIHNHRLLALNGSMWALSRHKGKYAHWFYWPIWQGLRHGLISYGNNGPIQSYWQLFPWGAMGPFNVLVLSQAGMGPSTVSSISHEQQWAHSMSSAACLGSYNGPPMIFSSIILQPKWPHLIILTTFICWPMCKLQQFTEWADFLSC